jgi:hypothetical protein
MATLIKILFGLAVISLPPYCCRLGLSFYKFFESVKILSTILICTLARHKQTLKKLSLASILEETSFSGKRLEYFILIFKCTAHVVKEK